MKRGAIEHNPCLIQLSPFDVRNFFSVLAECVCVGGGGGGALTYSFALIHVHEGTPKLRTYNRRN